MQVIEQLFKYNRIYDHQGSSPLFIKAMRESIRHHVNHCSFYKQLLEEADYHVDMLKTEKDLAQIPTIPAHFFKYHEIMSIDPSQVAIHATSSGTQGQKSQVFLDKNSVRLGTKMIIKAMKYHGLISLLPTNYMLLGYEPREGNAMGNVKVLLGMMRFAPAVGKAFALRSVGSDYHIDYFGIIAALKRYAKMRLPVRMLGFPAYLYMLLKMLQDNHMTFNLSNKSVILTGGGWKQYNDQAIDKEELHGLVESVLGIPAKNCRDFYSAVEHSVAYPECKHHHMHVPIWSRVVIRDVKTLEPVGFDQPGFLSFISPLVSSMPISSIIMGDMAVLRDGSQCGCGITTPYFEVLGRAGTSRGKSCAMTAAEFMKGGSHGASI